ncbi:hypothetical protein [Alcanivorax sediminis]|uniref:Uncharacterized protein n=1 Tax=Alcanivorax sediminis TaxID=2663008 RepID=A0A6N7LVQ3_9GAMM|nr:hypothetical protein [Alcanivorax sediminis]MQX52210.1 hypothetical protein [Alcanivorax sediminis]
MAPVFSLLLIPFHVMADGLTGLWVGYYSYSESSRVPMSMVIQSNGEEFFGQMIEPQTRGENIEVGRPSAVVGDINEYSVIFDKTYYSDLESLQPFKLKEGARSVNYMLDLSADSNTMTGSWYIGNISGGAVFKRVTPGSVDSLR